MDSRRANSMMRCCLVAERRRRRLCCLGSCRRLLERQRQLLQLQAHHTPTTTSGLGCIDRPIMTEADWLRMSRSAGRAWARLSIDLAMKRALTCRTLRDTKATPPAPFCCPLPKALWASRCHGHGSRNHQQGAGNRDSIQSEVRHGRFASLRPASQLLIGLLIDTHGPLCQHDTTDPRDSNHSLDRHTHTDTGVGLP